MRVAVIDCGTNTFNLSITEIGKDFTLKKVFNTRLAVKLGEGAINQGFIALAPMQRALDAMVMFSRHCEEHGAKKILAFATSAIRDARNGSDFVNVVKKATGINIQVIDGVKEAELIYLGNRQAVKMSGDISLIMDIGGGSTEFVLANANKIFWKHSFNIGAARLLDRFKPSDPITVSEIKLVNQYLENELILAGDAVKKYKPVELIGSSGAFESVIELIHFDLGGESLVPYKTEYNVNILDYKTIYNKIIGSSLSQRKEMKGLVPMRQDMIVISFLLMDFVLRGYNLNQFRVSSYSLKEGALIDYLDKTLGDNMY